MTRKTFISLWPIFTLLLSVSLVQGSASLAKSLFPILGPDGVAAWRLTFSALLLGLIFKPWKKKITKSAWLPLIIYGIAIGIMNVTFYNAIQRIPVGIGIAIELAMGPIAVALFSSRRISDFCWLGLVVLGLYMLLPLHQHHDVIDPIGIIFAMVSGLCWAMYIIFGKKAGTLYGPGSSAVGILIASFFVFPYGLLTNDIHTMFSPTVLPMALLVAIFASALPYGLEMIALPHISAKTFSMLMSLSPVVGSLSAFIFLHESLTMIQWLAILAIVCSSVGIIFSSQRVKSHIDEI